MSTTDFIAAIELSSSRIAGIAGQKHGDGSIEVRAYACADSTAFVRKGQVYNIDKAAHAIQDIVTDLQSQLGQTIAKVYAGIGGQSLRTVENHISQTLDEESIISSELVDRLSDENRDLPLNDFCVLDVAPQEFSIDNKLYTEPVGVAGRHITARYLNLVARYQLRKNLEQAFEKAGIKLADMPVAPLALARAVLTDNETHAGCALVDLGAGTTTVQVYKKNLLRYLCVLPLGGNNITRDLTCLKIEENEAEHLKLAYGSALYTDTDDELQETCQLEDGREVKLRELNDIIGARAEEILTNAWNQIQLSGYENELFAGIVLTGGAAALADTESLFRKISHTDKVRTAAFVCANVQGCETDMVHDGRQNTLLGLLAAGTENCCQQPVKPQSKPEPRQTTIGFSDDTEKDGKKTETTEPAPEPAPTPQPHRPANEPTKSHTSNNDKGKKSGNGGKRPGLFGGLFDRFRDSMLDDNSDKIND